MNQIKTINWKIVIFLVILSILHLIFLFILTTITRIKSIQDFPIDFYIDIFPIILIFIQAIFFGIIIVIGLYLGKRVGLGAPLLKNWINGNFKRNLLLIALSFSILCGFVVTVIKLFLDYFIFSPFVPSLLVQWKLEPIELLWIVPFDQGINAEIIYRLFLMTFFVWFLSKNQSLENKEIPAITFWIAILLTSLISGFISSIHGTYELIKLQFFVFSSIGGVIFGWLYWKKGIESAILAHFISNLVLVLIILKL